jgi:hypothetical protein
MKIRTIGITGADGTIGTVLRASLGAGYRISSFTMRAAEFPSTVADLSRAAEVSGLFVQAFTRALQVDTPFLVAYAISNNARRVFELESTTMSLGYKPVADAEAFF